MLKKKLTIFLVIFLIIGVCLVAKAAQQAVEKVKEILQATGRNLAKINVFAILSDDLNSYAIKVSEALRNQEGIEAFPIQGFQIHCTLYMTHYEPDKIPLIEKFLASFTAGIRQFQVKTTGLHCTKDNWLFINLEKNRYLQTLSDEIVIELSNLRAPVQTVPEWLKDYPEKVEYFKKYGSPNVFAEFDPHLTLTAKSDGEKIKRFISANANNSEISGEKVGKVVAVGMAIADRFGQIKECIATFPLSLK